MRRPTALERINARRRGELEMRSLNSLAYHFYLNTDPLTVYKWNDGTFTVTGVIEEDFDSFEDLEKCFEETEKCFEE